MIACKRVLRGGSLIGALTRLGSLATSGQESDQEPVG